MAVLGEWRGGSTSLLPGTSWAAPSNLLNTQARNDSSAYSINYGTSTVTLPSTGLADGYLIVAAFEFDDTSNGRHNPSLRVIQASGTGDVVQLQTSGYNRDASEHLAWCRAATFVHNPSASATFQIQWKRDSDAPTGGTTFADLQVIPLFYSNHGLYTSTTTTIPDGNTPAQLTGFSAVSQSDTAAIEIASNVVTVKGDNKRYLCLGGYYAENMVSNRSQRYGLFEIDGAASLETLGYSYLRNSSNNHGGEISTILVETVTADRTIEFNTYRGPAVGSFPNFGAPSASTSTETNANHGMVILELNDSAEVFKSHSDTQTNIRTAGTDVDLSFAQTVDFNDSASFTKASNTVVNAEQAMDVLLGANIGGGYAVSSGARYTGRAHVTINGTEQQYSRSGDYGRGDQGSADAWGWSANLLSFHAVALNDDIGFSAGKIAGGEGGPVDALAGNQGFWGINLDTLEGSAGETFDRTATINATSSVAATGTVSTGFSRTVAISATSGLSGQSVLAIPDAAIVSGTSTVSATGTVEVGGETFNRTAAISGTSGISGQSVLAIPEAATIAGVSTVTATESTSTEFARTATIAATSSVSGVADLDIARSVLIGATSTVSATSALEAARSATISAQSTVAATAGTTTEFPRDASIAATSGVTADRGLEIPRTATIAATSTVAALSGVGIPSTANIAGASTVGAVATQEFARTATISAVSTVSAAGDTSTELNRTASVTATSSLSGQSVLAIQDAANIAATSTVTATGELESATERTVVIAATSTLGGSANLDIPESALVEATSTVTATATVSSAIERTASIAATSSLGGQANLDIPESAVVSATSTVSATAGQVIERTVTVAAQSTVTALAEKIFNGSATIAATSTVSVADGQLVLERTATIAATSFVDVVSSADFARTANINAQSGVSVIQTPKGFTPEESRLSGRLVQGDLDGRLVTVRLGGNLVQNELSGRLETNRLTGKVANG